jgi:hypothetical protein
LRKLIKPEPVDRLPWAFLTSFKPLFQPPESLMKIQFTVTSRKPRNPMVTAAKFRSAGSHQMSAGAMRQGNNQSLRRELDQLERRPKPT